VTIEIGLLLGIVALATLAFAFEWLSADVVGLGLLLTLILTGLLPSASAFAGFGSDTVILILSLLIMTAALTRSGAVESVAQALLRHTGVQPKALLLAILLAVGGLSAFISNTAAAAFFVPVVIGLAEKLGVSPSRFLMPVAFAAILSSSVTLISTSTNVVVSGLMTSLGLEGFRMFELSVVGIPILLLGLAYLFFVGHRWIPERAGTRGMVEEFGIRSYVTEVLILPASPLVGQTLAASAWGHKLDLQVLRIVRDKRQHLLPQGNMLLRAGDVLLVEGPRAEVLKVKDTTGIEIKPDVELSDPNLRSEDLALVEALVVPGSPLVGRTLRGLRFRDRHGLLVLGINREGRNILRQLSRLPLKVGDVLLVQGSKTNLAASEEERAFSILNAVEEKRTDRRRAWPAAAIFAGAIVLAASNLVAVPVAMLLGAFLVFLTRCITPADAYREVEWRLIILVGCMLGLGAAMSHTGAAAYLAAQLVGVGSDWNPTWLLGGFFLLTVLLTQIMSNQGAAVVLLPIAIQTATQLGYNPRPFAVVITVAASCSFMTPLEAASLLVYGPGRYRFSDFLKDGAPLTLLLLGAALLLIPWFWPLKPGG
jgi:di/tricarboxylate transporter